MADNSIVQTIADTTTAYLKLILEDQIAAADETRAGLVRIGLLQASPLTAGINILTQFNDPDDPQGWRHGILPGPGHKLDLDMPAYEIGGGQMWFRRYTTVLELFFKNGATRVRSEELAQIILSRAELAIMEAPLPTENPDSFGEIALKTFIHSDTNIEGGGTGQFIFHGKIWWQCLTQKTRTGGFN